MELLNAAINDIRHGNKSKAQRKLAQVLRNDKNNEQAWLWMSQAVDDPARKRQCYQQVLRINPRNQAACRALGQEIPSPDGTQPRDAAQPPMQKTTVQPPLEAGSPHETSPSPLQTIRDFWTRANDWLAQSWFVQSINELSGLKVGIILAIIQGLVIGIPILVLAFILKFLISRPSILVYLLVAFVLLVILVAMGLIVYLIIKNNKQKQQARQAHIQELVADLQPISLPQSEHIVAQSQQPGDSSPDMFSKIAILLRKVSDRDPDPLLSNAFRGAAVAIATQIRRKPQFGIYPLEPLNHNWDQYKNKMEQLRQQLWRLEKMDVGDQERQLINALQSIDQTLRAAFDGYQSFWAEYERVKDAYLCPGCQRPLQDWSKICPYCQYDLSSVTPIKAITPTSAPPPTDTPKAPIRLKKKHWFHSGWVKLLGAMLFSPVTWLSVLTDPDESTASKVVSTIWLLITIVFVAITLNEM